MQHIFHWWLFNWGENYCINMRVFAWIASCIVIASAIAVENLYEDTENTSDAALFLDMDQMPIDTLAMTDFSIPYSLGQESLNLFESDDLASNFLSPEKMDSVLIGDTSNRCTNLIGNKRRIRRAGEAFCSNQDSGPVPYDYFKLDFSAASTFPVTGFDRLKCGVNPVPSYLVCSAPDPSDPLTASLSALGSLDPCTRGMFVCLRSLQTLIDFSYSEQRRRFEQMPASK